MHAIAIDGTSGAGKSTIAGLLAKRLGIHHLDTGAIYRALAYAADKEQIDLNNLAEVEKWLPLAGLEVQIDDQGQRTLIKGQDVEPFIRTAKISLLTSALSALPPVRYYSTALQRELAAKYFLVLEGRDIGSFVLPQADFKFYLDASPEERAKRRWQQMKEQAKASEELQSYEEVLQDIITRDQKDSSRDLAPAGPAADAIIIDTSDLNIDQVLDLLLQLMQEKADLDLSIRTSWQKYLDQAFAQ